MGAAMIDVHSAANLAVQVVNPDLLGTFYASTGSTSSVSYAQVPTYAAPVNVPMQVQGVSARDLKQLEGMNAQGVLRSVHMFGNTQGVVRVNQEGGDLLYFAEIPTGTPRMWKVVKVMETWPTWSRVIVNLQTDLAPPSPPPP